MLPFLDPCHVSSDGTRLGRLRRIQPPELRPGGTARPGRVDAASVSGPAGDGRDGGDVDEIEQIAIDRAKALFGANFANVQPNSGSQMNQAVFLALLQPGDSFMGLDLNSGGHLTHGLVADRAQSV